MSLSAADTFWAALVRETHALIVHIPRPLGNARAAAERLAQWPGQEMSQEDVEIVRAIYSLWNSGESARDLIDPELEYVNPSYAVEPGIRRGRGPLGKLREVYPDLRVEPERFVDAGQHVVVIATVHGTSVSGVTAQWRQGYVWTVSDGKAIRFRWFNHPSEALEAVGLEG